MRTTLPPFTKQIIQLIFKNLPHPTKNGLFPLKKITLKFNNEHPKLVYYLHKPKWAVQLYFVTERLILIKKTWITPLSNLFLGGFIMKGSDVKKPKKNDKKAGHHTHIPAYELKEENELAAKKK